MWLIIHCIKLSVNEFSVLDNSIFYTKVLGATLVYRRVKNKIFSWNLVQYMHKSIIITIIVDDQIKKNKNQILHL